MLVLLISNFPNIRLFYIETRNAFYVNYLRNKPTTILNLPKHRYYRYYYVLTLTIDSFKYI